MSLAVHPKYEKYSRTNVSWIKQIPEGWKLLRIQDFSTFNDEVIDERAFRNKTIRYVDISGVDSISNKYAFEEQNFSTAPSRARRLVRSGDTVFSTVRPYLKAVATIEQPEIDLVFSTGFAVIRPSENADPRFTGYAMRNDPFINEVTANSVGASYPAINATDLVKLHVPLPPLDEQRVIASFLDDKCEKIDEAVRIKEAQIALLRERRQILIQEAVTRGLNPAAPMKDSSIDWIGQIPAHWELKRLKHLLNERNERSKNGEEPLLMVSQVHGLVVRADFHSKAEVSASNIDNKIVHENDLVFNKLKAHLGVFFKSNIQDVGIVSPDYAVYTPSGGIADSKFFELLFRHPAYIGQFIVRATGIVEGLIRLYTSDLFDIHIAVPPENEQIEIITYSNEISDKFNRAITLKQDQITALKEYKTSLINAAVTGKIKVI